MMFMRPPRPARHLVFRAIDRVGGLLGATEPLHWLTMSRGSSRRQRSEPVDLYVIDGRTYILDIRPSKRWSDGLGVSAQATLTTGRSDADVTLTEVADQAVKHQVVIAFAARKPETVLTPGKSKQRREPESALVLLRLAPDDTPEGLAAAVPYVTVFEVTPSG
jgi:hypothetical protein